MSGNRFIKGQTNNHLTWVMVDATDFATPESALSAATKIKIYGKLKSATGVNFVSSGTGSLTNDIQHVGASALGIYTIALAKADLSDASAAWYDQYIVSLSATGAAYQALIVDGGIMASYLSDVGSYLSATVSDIRSDVSDMHSDLIVMSDILSNAYSAAVVGASRILLVQSRLSDFNSVYTSDMSDVRSMLTALSDAISNVDSAVNSQFAVVSNYLSNISAMVSDTDSAANSQYSDLASKIGAITVSISASDVSDIASAVLAGMTVTSDISDIYSLLSSLNSEFLSRVPKAVATNSQVSDLASDLRSYLVGLSDQLSDFNSDMRSLIVTTGVNLNTSVMSDIRSAITAATGDPSTLSDIYSGITVLQSRITDVTATASDLVSKIEAGLMSDLYSLLSDTRSTMDSQFAVVSNYLSNASNYLSDISSTLGSQFAVESNYLSYLSAVLSDFQSDFQSRVPKAVATNSQVSDLASDLKSYMAGLSGALSDLDSAATSQYSDLASKIGNVSVTIGASDISDIASAVAAGIGFTPAGIASKVWSDYESRAGATVSQHYSVLNLAGSRISDISSYLAAMSGMLSDVHSAAVVTQSLASDAHSAAAAAASRATLMQSTLSDIDSAVSSQFAALSGMVSDVDSALSSQFTYMSNAVSDLGSDLGSKIGAVSVTLGASDISDLASALVAAGVGGNVTHVRGQSLIGTGVASDPWRPA